MKKILILTYQFPPCNSIGSQRSKSFAENFSRHGLYPVVVTRHWKGNETTWEDYQSVDEREPSITDYGSYSVIALPYRASYQRFFSRFDGNFLTRKVSAVARSLLGISQIHNFAIESFGPYLRKYLRDDHFDFVLAMAGPFNLIKLGHSLSLKYGMPLIVDFRDVWNFNKLKRSHLSTTSEKFHDRCFEFYLRRWLGVAKLASGVSEPILSEINRVSPGLKTLLVTNGFEEKELFTDVPRRERVKTKKFTFSLVGSIFPAEGQDLSVLEAGMKLFLAGKDLKDIELRFIGTAGTEAGREFVERNFPPECTILTVRIPRLEALAEMRSSNVLFYAGWRSFKGIPSGKIFDYFASGENVLVAPGDGDILEKLVVETKTGKVANSPEEFSRILNDWFAEWKNKGFLRYTGDRDVISRFTRERQAELLATEIRKAGRERFLKAQAGSGGQM